MTVMLMMTLVILSSHRQLISLEIFQSVFVITNQVFKVSNLLTFFYSENIVYPYVALQEQKKGLLLENNDFTEIIKHVQEKHWTSFDV